MNKVYWGGLLAVGLLIGVGASPRPVMPGGPQVGPGNERLITVSQVLDEKRQQIVVIDPQTHAMCVYHIEGGSIKLMSARNLHWDLQMEHFNGVVPLPSEIRARLE